MFLTVVANFIVRPRNFCPTLYSIVSLEAARVQYFRGAVVVSILLGQLLHMYSMPIGQIF